MSEPNGMGAIFKKDIVNSQKNLNIEENEVKAVINNTKKHKDKSVASNIMTIFSIFAVIILLLIAVEFLLIQFYPDTGYMILNTYIMPILNKIKSVKDTL